MRHFLLFTICFLTYTVRSQSFYKGIEIKYKTGFLIAHRAMMNHLPKEHTKAVDVTYYFQTKNSKNWHTALKNPRLGATFTYTNAGNNKILGSFYGLFSFLEFPFINKVKSKLFGKIGCGLGYGNKVYDPITNPKNNAISSHFNALVNFGIFYQYHFKKSYLITGFDLTHFSNGAIRTPNLGVNLPYFSFGFGRLLTKNVQLTDIEKLPKPVNQYKGKPWTFSFIAILSAKDNYPTGMKREPILAFNLSTQKVFKHGAGYEVGMDLFYKKSIKYYKPNIYKPNETYFQLGLYNAYLLTLDKMQVIVGMGIYLKDEYFSDSRLYHRVGLRYRVANKLILNLTLKSHWAKADYVEYGIGYTL